MIILANPRSDWNVLRPLLFESIGQTLTMVLVTLVIGGFLGLILGVVLYGTRPGNLFENAVVYRILDIIVNIVRPSPFIIFLAAMQPLTIVVVGTSIGTVAAIFEKYGVQTFCAILGLVISSPIAIFINTGLVSKLGSLSLWEILFGIVLMAAGAFVTVFVGER